MILKHRDRELLRFEWIGPQGVHVVSVNESERKLLPLEMTGAADDDALQDLLDRLRRIKDFLQKRVSEILEFGDKADEFLKISRERDSVNHANNGSCALQIKENLKADPYPPRRYGQERMPRSGRILIYA